MSKKITKVVFMIMVVIITLWNSEIMPVKKEMKELYLIKVSGADIIDEGIYKVEKTIVKLETDAKSNSPESKESSDENSESGNQSDKNFSVKAVSLSDAIRSLQTYTDKTISGSHIRYFIIGEETAKKDIERALDFEIRDFEVRTAANVYITKGITAKEFLDESTKGSYQLDKKLESMEDNIDSKGISEELSLIKLLDILSKEDGAGLIPSLEIISNKEETIDEDSIKNEDITDKGRVEVITQDVLFDFAGYGIIKDKKLIGYLDREESSTANILMDKFKGGNIDLPLDKENNEVVVCRIKNSKIKYKFKFDENNNIEEINIINNFRTDIEEVDTQRNIFEYNQLNGIEQIQSEQMKERIENLIKKMAESDSDFLNISGQLRKSHPYKYLGIKDKFMEQFKNAKINVEVNSVIRRTYDYVRIGGVN